MTTPAPDERDIFREIVLGSAVPARMASAMVSSPPTSSISRRWGVVTAIDAVNGTVSVNVSGVIIPGVRRIATYAPTVGETVAIDVVGKDMLVIGTFPPSPLNDLSALNATVSANIARLNTLENRPLLLLRGSNTASALQAIPTSTWTDIGLGVQDTLLGNIAYNATTDRAKILTAGWYDVNAAAGIHSSSAAGRKGVRRHVGAVHSDACFHAIATIRSGYLLGSVRGKR
jgi:hypothetical protein